MNTKINRWNVILIVIGLVGALFIFTPATQVSAQAPKLFRLKNFSGALVLMYERTRETRLFSDVTALDLTRNYFQGGIQLDTLGSLYHPNFVSFRANLNLLAHRTKNVLFSDAAINNDINNSYDLGLTFLKKKKLNLELYGVRNYYSYDVAFIERTYSIFNTFGAKLRSQFKLLPFTLDVYYNRLKTESLTYSQRDETSRNVDLRAGLLNLAKTRANLDFRYKDYNEDIYGIDFQSMNLMVNVQHFYNTKRSGGADSAFSILNFRRMRGDNEFTAFNLYTSARYLIRKKLFVRGEYRLLSDDSFDRESTEHSLVGRLHHQLYESLDTVLMVENRSRETTYLDIASSRYGVSFNYRKKIPTGIFRVAYMTQREDSHYRSSSDVASIGENYTFSLSDSIVITQPGVNLGSIVVTDPDYMYIYVAEVDYHVEVVQNVVTIIRLPGGAIPPGGKIRVNYEYMAVPDFKLKGSLSQVNVNLDVLKMFNFYFRQGINKPVTESDYTVMPFVDYNRVTLGAKFFTRLLNAEYFRENYQSSFSDYVMDNFRVATNIKLGRRFMLTGNLIMNRLNYKPATYFSHMDAYTGEVSYFPFQQLAIRGLYRKINYSTPMLDRERESIIFKLNWTMRRIIVDLFYEHIFNGSFSNEWAHNYLSLVIRRTF